MKNYLSLWILILTLIACQSQQDSKLPEYLLSPNAPETILSLSDLAEDMNIVPLETSDSILIPNQFKVFVTPNRLIVSGTEHLYVFSQNGKYIGKLLTCGRGPEEYDIILNCRIDEKQQLLYLLDRSQHLFICDLKTNQLLKCQTLPFHATQILEVSGDTLLYHITPTFMDSTHYTFCRMTLDSELIEYNSIPNKKEFLSDESCYQLINDEIRYKPDGCDTLYAIEQLQSQPIALLKCENIKPDFKNYIFPFLENSNSLVIRSSLIQTEIDHQGELKSFSIEKGNSYLVDKKTGKTKRIKQFCADLLNLEMDLINLQVSNDYLIVSVNAFRLKEELKERYEQNKLTPELKQLYENTEETDNPILIIGKIKA